jgi:hypothetical protein
MTASMLSNCTIDYVFTNPFTGYNTPTTSWVDMTVLQAVAAANVILSSPTSTSSATSATSATSSSSSQDGSENFAVFRSTQYNAKKYAFYNVNFVSKPLSLPHPNLKFVGRT